jgi:hypothetical protein
VLNAFAEFAKGNVDILPTVLHEDFTEHWDVLQAVPDPAETPHGMF